VNEMQKANLIKFLIAFMLCSFILYNFVLLSLQNHVAIAEIDISRVGSELTDSQANYKRAFVYRGAGGQPDSVLLLPKSPGSLTLGELLHEQNMLEQLNGAGLRTVSLEIGELANGVPYAISSPRLLTDVKSATWNNPSQLSSLLGGNLDAVYNDALGIRQLLKANALQCFDVQLGPTLDPETGQMVNYLFDPLNVRTLGGLSDEVLENSLIGFDNRVINPLNAARAYRAGGFVQPQLLVRGGLGALGVAAEVSALGAAYNADGGRFGNNSKVAAGGSVGGFVGSGIGSAFGPPGAIIGGVVGGGLTSYGIGNQLDNRPPRGPAGAIAPLGTQRSSDICGNQVCPVPQNPR
jgi:hypothetical protein